MNFFIGFIFASLNHLFILLCNRNVGLKGYLFKRGSSKFKMWNRRYFVMKDNQLQYQKKGPTKVCDFAFVYIRTCSYVCMYVRMWVCVCSCLYTCPCFMYCYTDIHYRRLTWSQRIYDCVLSRMLRIWKDDFALKLLPLQSKYILWHHTHTHPQILRVVNFCSVENDFL